MSSRETYVDNYTVEHQRHTYNSSGTIVSTATTYSGNDFRKTVDSVDTPNYHKLLECGKFLPLNPFVVSTRTTRSEPGNGTFTTHLGNVEASGPYAYAYQPGHDGWHFPVPEPDQSIVDAVVLAAMANASSSAWDFSTFLAEFSKSYQALASAYRNFNTFRQHLAYEAWRKSLRERVSRRVKSNPWQVFRELWLGARYTVRPMVYDVRDAANAIAKLLNGNEVWAKARSTQTVEIEDSWVGPWLNVTSKVRGYHTESMSGTMTYRAIAFCAIDDGINGILQVDLPVTLYETLPYSFVLDWFYDIGSWIQTLRPYLTGKFLGVASSVKWELEVEHTYQSFPRPVSNPLTGSFEGAKNFWTLSKYQRVPTSGDLPSPSVLPRMTLPRMIDLVALLVTGDRKMRHIMNRR